MGQSQLPKKSHIACRLNPRIMMTLCLYSETLQSLLPRGFAVFLCVLVCYIGMSMLKVKIAFVSKLYDCLNGRGCVEIVGLA